MMAVDTPNVMGPAFNPATLIVDKLAAVQQIVERTRMQSKILSDSVRLLLFHLVDVCLLTLLKMSSFGFAMFLNS